MTKRLRLDQMKRLRLDQMRRLRLDQLLVEKFGYESRSRARDAVKRGAVSIDGRMVTKAGLMVAEDAAITIRDAARDYVSRAALKLAHALKQTGLDISGRSALDLGASTGGFTQVLLQAGAARVVAVDVGSGQLHALIAADPRVISIENRNARDLTLADLGGARPGVVTADLSFISLKTALPAALDLAAAGAIGVFLVKPQFEAGKAALGRGGILRDASRARAIAEDLLGWLDARPGWRASHLLPSPIAGGDGNREFLLCGAKDRAAADSSRA